MNTTYNQTRLAYINAGRPLKEKPKKLIKKVSDKRQQKINEQREAASENALDLWFEKGMKECEPVCAECGFRADWLKEEKYKEIWRACQAHILPKRKEYGFTSIAANNDNRIILFPSWGGLLCGHHGYYDSNWYNASTMKIWPKVLEIIKDKLIPCIAEKEYKNIPEIILKHINQ